MAMLNRGELQVYKQAKQWILLHLVSVNLNLIMYHRYEMLLLSYRYRNIPIICLSVCIMKGTKTDLVTVLSLKKHTHHLSICVYYEGNQD